MTNDMCQKKFREKYKKHPDIIVSSKQLCAMGIPGEYTGAATDTCQGDSGGPAVEMVDVLTETAILENWSEKRKKEEKNKRALAGSGAAPQRGELIGITSWGLSCGAGTPGVYTRVTEYMQWISLYTDKMSTVHDQEFN